jgi:hypothetical protein
VGAVSHALVRQGDGSTAVFYEHGQHQHKGKTPGALFRLKKQE